MPGDKTRIKTTAEIIPNCFPLLLRMRSFNQSTSFLTNFIVNGTIQLSQLKAKRNYYCLTDTKMNHKVIIIGAFHEIIELVESTNLKIYGLVDDKKHNYYRNYKIILNDSDGEILSKDFIDFPIIISPDSPFTRERLFKKYYEAGFKFINVISNNIGLSKSATIGNGLIIQDFVNISAEATIGNFVKLNTYCNIMHNVRIGDFTTVAPNAVVLGNVTIGNLCYIGSNSTILPNIEICDNVTIGAGAVVTKNINHPGKYIGIPANIMS